jgi:hypothetical protein
MKFGKDHSKRLMAELQKVFGELDHPSRKVAQLIPASLSIVPFPYVPHLEGCRQVSANSKSAKWTGALREHSAGLLRRRGICARPAQQHQGPVPQNWTRANSYKTSQHINTEPFSFTPLWDP